jgi:ribonuclease Z
VAPRRLTRRDLLKNSGAAIGGFAVAGVLLEPSEARAALACEGNCYPPADEAERQRYSYFQKQLPGLKYYQDRGGFLSASYPPLEPDEMRVTFMGSTIPPTRRAQQMMSIFVEVGWDPVRKRAKDQFVFDCGAGVVANYGAMDVGFGRMDKIFLTHLHGDHLSDVTHVYCFGPASDRLSPLYIWGPGPSGVPNPKPPHQLYDDGTKTYCSHLREALRWHTESFSFQPTTYAAPYPTASEIEEKWGLPVLPAAVSDDPWGDAYAMVPIELDWIKVGGVAYHNKETGVRITHFPVIHCRKGSIAYKLEWNGLSMIFSGDTKPEKISIEQAKNGGRGVTVFVHEMVVPAEIWAMQAQHLPRPLPRGANQLWDDSVDRAIAVQDSSHTPQGAFGYLLSQIDPRPQLTVATHFPVSDDTVDCAMRSVRNHVPDIGSLGERLTFSFDGMVISAYAGSGKVTQRRAEVLEFGSLPVPLIYGAESVPKYHLGNGLPDPYAQIDRTQEIQAGEQTYCRSGY